MPFGKKPVDGVEFDFDTVYKEVIKSANEQDLELCRHKFINDLRIKTPKDTL